MSSTERKSNKIPPWERIAVNAATAAEMLSCGRSTFFARVKEGVYPKPGRDGRWSVSALRQIHQASETTTT
jgi:predicted DNA-binding transcriptional regulator AlpA